MLIDNTNRSQNVCTNIQQRRPHQLERHLPSTSEATRSCPNRQGKSPKPLSPETSSHKAIYVKAARTPNSHLPVSTTNKPAVQSKTSIRNLEATTMTAHLHYLLSAISADYIAGNVIRLQAANLLHCLLFYKRRILCKLDFPESWGGVDDETRFSEVVGYDLIELGMVCACL